MQLHYSLIQFTPDAFRRESVNLGVVAFRDGDPAVMRTVENPRAHIVGAFGAAAFHGREPALLKLVEARVRALASANSDNITRLARQLSHEIRLTEPDSANYSTLDEARDALFRDLVDRPTATKARRAEPVAQVTRRLRNELDRAGLGGFAPAEQLSLSLFPGEAQLISFAAVWRGRHSGAVYPISLPAHGTTLTERRLLAERISAATAACGLNTTFVMTGDEGSCERFGRAINDSSNATAVDAGDLASVIETIRGAA